MAQKKKVTGIIQIYSKKARDQIFGIGKKFATEAGISGVADDVFACVDELIKNAVKANYKFLLVVDKISSNLKNKYDGISAQEAHIPVFGRSFERRSGNADIDPFAVRNVQAVGNFFRFTKQAGVIRVSHVRKSWSEFFIVRAFQRIFHHEVHHVDMIFQEHHVAHLEPGIQSAACI